MSELFSGERQVGPTRSQIRPDHTERYFFAGRHLRGKAVIDAGCGVGYGSHILTDFECTVYGYDRSEEAIEYASKHYSNLSTLYEVGNVEKHDLDDIQADAVVAFEVLEHLAHPERALRRWRRAARQLIVSVPNEARFPFGGSVTFHVRHYTKDELRELLAENGWKVVAWYGQKDQMSPPEPDLPWAHTIIALCEKTELYIPLPVEPTERDILVTHQELVRGKAPKSVAIVAMGSSILEYVDVAASGKGGKRWAVADEVWGVNGSGGLFQVDRVFQMDDLHVQELRAEAGNPQIAGMVSWLKTTEVPVYTSRVYPGYENLVEYPLEFVLNRTGHAYFEDTSVPYIVAFAIAIGVEEIQLYGCDYGWKGQSRRENGRACLEYWVAVAKERGVTVKIPSISTLLGYNSHPKQLYGYETEWLSIEVEDGEWTVGRAPKAPVDVPTALEVEYRYSHDPEQERLEAVARHKRKLDHQARQVEAMKADGALQEEERHGLG